MYHPVLGKWTSRDPLGLDAGLNLSEYVGSNPTNLVDPTGLDCCCCCVDEATVKQIKRFILKKTINDKWVEVARSTTDLGAKKPVYVFAVDLTLSYPRAKGDKDSDCTLQWLEGQNYVGGGNTKPDPKDTPFDKLTLVDQYKRFGGNEAFYVFDGWRQRARPCGENERVAMIDDPTTQRADFDKRLRIKVVVKSSCPKGMCKKDSWGYRLDITIPSDASKPATVDGEELDNP